jgi:hypothetical protein
MRIFSESCIGRTPLCFGNPYTVSKKPSGHLSSRSRRAVRAEGPNTVNSVDAGTEHFGYAAPKSGEEKTNERDRIAQWAIDIKVTFYDKALDMRRTIEVRAFSPIAAAEAAMKWMIDQHLTVTDFREAVEVEANFHRGAQGSLGRGHETDERCGGHPTTGEGCMR